MGHSLGLELHARHPADNLHLTLVFLGQQNETAQQRLWHDCIGLFQLHKTEPLQLTIDHLAVFEQAKVLYLGISQPAASLITLQKQLQLLALPFLNLPISAQFVPHVTLARKFKSAEVLPLLVKPLNLVCTEVALYHSINSVQGVKYQAVQSYTLVPKV